MNYQLILLLSLGLNIVLLFVLFSSNLNYFINKRWFKWRDEEGEEKEEK